MLTKNVCACCLWLLLCGAVSAEHFVGFLDGLQENPPVPTPGTGFGTADYDPVTQMLSVAVSFSDLIGTTTNAHIHCCATEATTNSGIALHFVPHGFPLGVTSGNFSHTFDLSQASAYDAGFLAASGSGTAAEARDRLLDAMRFGVPNDSDIAYFNIHTSFRAGGEIRGNIAVPEPSVMLLLTCGLAPLAFARRAR
jgi:CHRD domain